MAAVLFGKLPTNNKLYGSELVKMPNGKPGDHPFTDIAVHGMAVFGEEIDNLVRELSRHPSYHRFSEQVSQVLLKNVPRWQNTNSNKEHVLKVLNSVQQKLQSLSS